LCLNTKLYVVAAAAAAVFAAVWFTRFERLIVACWGRRDCLGKLLGEATCMAALVALLGNFNFRLADKMGPSEAVVDSMVMKVTLKPSNGMWLHAIPRVS
jgi:hypothetical protein